MVLRGFDDASIKAGATEKFKYEITPSGYLELGSCDPELSHIGCAKDDVSGGLI